MSMMINCEFFLQQWNRTGFLFILFRCC